MPIIISNVFTLRTLTVLILLLFAFTAKEVCSADKSVSTFKNISPQSTSGSPTQTTGINQPTLSDRTIGALPAIKFNGSAHYLNYNGAPLAGKDYTIFVVEQRTAAVGAGGSYFFGTSAVTPAANVGLILGYKTDTQLVFSQGSNEEIIAIEPYSASAKPVIHTFVQDSVNGKKYYRNGALVFSDGSNTTPLVSNNNAFIGLNETNKYYQGNIAEVAVYKRAISASEIANVHGYLLDKWDVTVTNDGTACLGTSTPHSPGYVTVTNGVWPDAANGATSSISCTVGGVIGTINDMLCTNGVWSGGDGGGVCGISDCSDATPNTNVTYGTAILGNGGTWATPTGTISNGNSITATCPGGPVGTVPTLTCSAGTFNYNGGTCSPNCSDPAIASNFVLNTGTWDSTTAVNGGTITATCPTGNTGSAPLLSCNAGVLTSIGGNCIDGSGSCSPDPSLEFPVAASEGAWDSSIAIAPFNNGWSFYGLCPVGQSGSKRIICNNGSWTNYTNTCSAVSSYCPAIMGFYTNASSTLPGLSNGGANGECLSIGGVYPLVANVCCSNGKWAVGFGSDNPFIIYPYASSTSNNPGLTSIGIGNINNCAPIAALCP